MTIIQPTKPPDITPDKWTSEIWHYILKFLQPLDASFLFLRVVTDSKNLFIGQYDKLFEEYWLSPISYLSPYRG
jgi:hypothetical protein